MIGRVFDGDGAGPLVMSGDIQFVERGSRLPRLAVRKITLRIHNQEVHRVRVLSIPRRRHAQNSYFPLRTDDWKLAHGEYFL